MFDLNNFCSDIYLGMIYMSEIPCEIPCEISVKTCDMKIDNIESNSICLMSMVFFVTLVVTR